MNLSRSLWAFAALLLGLMCPATLAGGQVPGKPESTWKVTLEPGIPFLSGRTFAEDEPRDSLVYYDTFGVGFEARVLPLGPGWLSLGAIYRTPWRVFDANEPHLELVSRWQLGPQWGQGFYLGPSTGWVGHSRPLDAQNPSQGDVKGDAWTLGMQGGWERRWDDTFSGGFLVAWDRSWWWWSLRRGDRVDVYFSHGMSLLMALQMSAQF